MTIPIEPSSTQAADLVDAYSRYIPQNVIFYGENRYITFDTYLRVPYVPNGKEKIMLITKPIEYRPDYVSYEVYGIPNFWWKILEVNKMYDIWDFKAGKTIMLPSLA